MTANEYAEKIQAELGESWLPRLYQERVLKMRTRSYHFGSLKPAVKVAILHTLLGVELKAGRKRMLCPDLPTARYLSIFARLGCADVALPYDITRISHLADQLESSWYRMLLLVDFHAANESQRLRNRIRGLLIAKTQQAVSEAGVGKTLLGKCNQLKASLIADSFENCTFIYLNEPGVTTFRRR